MLKFRGFTEEITTELQQGNLTMEEAILLAGEKGLTLKDLK